MSFKPDDIYRELVERGHDWSDKNAAADLLEELKKPELARLANECNEASQSAKEAFAQRHPDYRAHVENMVEARRVANRAKVDYAAANVLAGLRQTEAANERAANRVAT